MVWVALWTFRESGLSRNTNLMVLFMNSYLEMVLILIYNVFNAFSDVFLSTVKSWYWLSDTATVSTASRIVLFLVGAIAEPDPMFCTGDDHTMTWHWNTDISILEDHIVNLPALYCDSNQTNLELKGIYQYQLAVAETILKNYWWQASFPVLVFCLSSGLIMQAFYLFRSDGFYSKMTHEKFPVKQYQL